MSAASVNWPSRKRPFRTFHSQHCANRIAAPDRKVWRTRHELPESTLSAPLLIPPFMTVLRPCSRCLQIRFFLKADVDRECPLFRHWWKPCERRSPLHAHRHVVSSRAAAVRFQGGAASRRARWRSLVGNRADAPPSQSTKVCFSPSFTLMPPVPSRTAQAAKKRRCFAAPMNS
jgi:hypothetical protein